MLAESKFKQLNQLIDSFSKEELIWSNGYLAGMVANGKSNDVVNSNGHRNVSIATRKISIVYGTETGNSKRLAIQLATAAKKKGILVKTTSLDQYRLDDLEQEEYLFIVISTHGEGLPPLSAKLFYDYIHHSTVNLSKLKFSVLALGDSSYPHFCKTGIDVDHRLASLGGTQIVELQKCDVDFEEDAQQWFDTILTTVNKSTSAISEITSETNIQKKARGNKFYTGKINANINLNDRGSNKQTFHIEIGTDEKIAYETGDAMGIIPSNKKIMVDLIFLLTGAGRDKQIETTRAKGSAEELLTNHLNICYLQTSTVRKYAEITQQEIPDTRIDFVDLLQLYPLNDISLFPDVIKLLSPIAPRLYSISSSPAAHGEFGIHLTVSRHSFRVNEEHRYGLCSDFLGELPIATPVSFYIHKNRSFKLPEPQKDIIMIGPGTGIAPFRAFLSERDATGAAGRNWLFFGDQHFNTDFLYQSEMQNLSHTGVLSKISLAFSRDQSEKIYVQNRIIEHGNELFSWIQSGASVYVCGTKDPNSIDIENALLEVIQKHGQLSVNDSKHYLAQLENDNRFVKDVY